MRFLRGARVPSVRRSPRAVPAADGAGNEAVLPGAHLRNNQRAHRLPGVAPLRGVLRLLLGHRAESGLHFHSPAGRHRDAAERL